MIWDDIFIITGLIIYTYFKYNRDINKKTAEEWNSWTNYMYTSSRLHRDQRKTYSILMILFMWTVGYWFYSLIINSFFD